VQSRAHDENEPLENRATFNVQGIISPKKRSLWINCESLPVGDLLATIQDERSFHLEKLGPCFSDSPDAGHEFFCRACRRSILRHSRTWSSCLTRRRPGWLSHLDSASPERL